MVLLFANDFSRFLKSFPIGRLFIFFDYFLR